MGADRWGVSDGFVDGEGRWVPAHDDTRRKIRRSMGAPEDGSGEPSPQTIVTRPGDGTRLGPGVLALEDGGEISLDADSALPDDLPIGYHRLVTDTVDTQVLHAPKRCVDGPSQRIWGWAVQLYAMRSRRSWGIGDLDDLARFSRWSAESGAGMALISPLHSPAPTLPQQPSPYYPSSRVYRNLLHLSIDRVDGAASLGDELAGLANTAQGSNSERLLDRDLAFRCKLDALERLWTAWKQRATQEERSTFDKYCTREGSVLQKYATFSAIVERHPGTWTAWPSDLRRPDSSGVAAFAAAHADRIELHRWIQWQIDKQLSTATPGIDLMTDVAIGVDRGGADAWMWQDSFCLDFSVGAPPDAFNTRGQEWGLPPFDPWRLRSHGYEPFIRTVRSAFQHAAAIRIDHVMGLFRLYWIPVGGAPQDGCYVYVPFQDLLAIVAIESHRGGAYVVGEDLGTVEPYVRDELANAGVLSYVLRQFEDRPTAELRSDALAAFTTHDLPTIAGLWSRSDLDDQRSLGLAPNEPGFEAVRSKLISAAGDALGLPSVVEATYRDLAGAPSAIVTATLDDALGVAERPNMPGTVDAWPNWRIALPIPLDDIVNDPGVAAVADALRR